MASIILILKGIIIGIGKIIPGVSGSLLAFSLGVYEKAIACITNFFTHPKENILYLGKLGLGVIIAIFLFSNVVLYFLEHYYLYTLVFFIGLLSGTIPYILKKGKIRRKRNVIFLLLAILLVVSLNAWSSKTNFVPKPNLLNYLYIIFIGFIDATTMIVPGISGTATFMMMGCYNFVLEMFSKPYAYLLYFSLFAVGILIGGIVISKVVAFLLKKHAEPLYLAIIGFSFSSIFYLLSKIILLFNYGNIITCLLLVILGYLLSSSLEKL